MSREHGLGGALRTLTTEAAAELEAARAASAGEQLDLIPLATTGHATSALARDKLEAEMTAAQRDDAARERHAAALARAEGQRRAGRPPGSANRSTEELRQFLFRRNASAAMRLVGWMQHTPESLAAELGCTKERAFEHLKDLWLNLLPYELPRLAPVDHKGEAVFPTFQFVVNGAPDAGPAGGGLAPWEQARGGVSLAGVIDASAQDVDLAAARTAAPPVSEAAIAAHRLMAPPAGGPADEA